MKGVGGGNKFSSAFFFLVFYTDNIQELKTFAVLAMKIRQFSSFD